MTEEGLAPKPATQKAMTQITGAVVAITVVLAAVFIPPPCRAVPPVRSTSSSR